MNDIFRKKNILEEMERADRYFRQQWPDPTKTIVTDMTRPSNIWTRATYYEGLMALYRINKNGVLYKYALDWSEFHHWGFRNGNTTRNPDDQCCGQVYIEMYEIEPKKERLKNITECIQHIMNDTNVDDWSWVDTLHMAMPIYAKLGVLYNQTEYFDKMHQLYTFSKTRHGDNGLYNPEDHLWWRDKDYDPPYTEPNGKNCYWSRGNGWVFAALARTLDVLPVTDLHYSEYVRDFQDMAKAIITCQREDGFWNVSLHDPDNFGGPETSGTAFFCYGLTWGIRKNLLDKAEYQQSALKSWEGLSGKALHANGFIGYVQGTGKEPADSQPVTYNSVPNHDDFGVGAFLLAGSEMYQLL